jgi:hypothetical protein
VAKLTIVVNCTERKSQAPSPELRVRSLPAGTSKKRFATWRRRIEAAAPSAVLNDLYQGEAWQQAKGLATDATDLGFNVKMLVASAGLGLRKSTSKVPAYAATFAPGHADTVATVDADLKDWWKSLKEFDSSLSLSEAAGDRVLLVLSDNYARAMDDDLSTLAHRGGDILLVGGTRTIEGIPRLPSDGSLRRALGGTVSTVGLRMARQWLAQRSGQKLFCSTDKSNWDLWADSVSYKERYDRTPVTDDQVRQIIRELKTRDPSLSATPALRMVRDSGTACEQQRFAELFRTTAAR